MDYRSILSDLPYGLVVFSLKGWKVDFYNHKFSELAGFSNDRSALCLADFLLVEGLQIIKKSIGKNEFGKKQKVSLKMSDKPIQIMVSPNSSKQDSFLLSFFEVLPGQEDKNTSIDERDYFNALMDSFPDTIYFKGLDNEFLKINNAFLQKHGFSNENELKGKTDFDIYDEEHARKAFDDEKEILKSKKPILNYIEKEVRPDGNISWVKTSKLPLRNKLGEIKGTFGISKDVTDEFIQSEKIREKNEILKSLTHKIPIIIYKFIDQSEEISFEYGVQELQNALLESKVARLKLKDNLALLIEKAFSSPQNRDYFSFISFNKEKNIWFENFIFREEDGHDTIGFSLDISDRIFDQKEIKKRSKYLIKINEELDRFAYIVSHDLKSPLRAIVSLSQFIEEDLKKGSFNDMNESMNLLRGRVKRMEDLISGILNYAKVNRNIDTYEHVNVKELLLDVLDGVCLPESFTMQVSENMPEIVFSKVNLEQVFTNLINNAIKHHDKEVGNIKITYEALEENHQFTVEDDGPGIDPELHQRIFEIFQTLKPKDNSDNTGVGLTIVKKIIEDSGGTIRIESEVGKGTKMIFSLPNDFTIKNNQSTSGGGTESSKELAITK